MFQIGDSLREARTRRGLSAADVQKGIRIRERYLTALEEERWEMLPGEAYTKGFLRTYAEFLGLNGNLYVDEFNSRFAHREEEPPLVPESITPTRTRPGLPRTIAIVVVVAAVVAGLASWRLAGSSTPAAKAPATTTGTTSPKPAATPPPAAKPTPPPAAPAPARLAVLSATRGRCWLSIRVGDANGRVLYQGILEQGRTLRYALKQNLWVRMGAPSMLDVTVGRAKVGGLPMLPTNVLLTRAGAHSA